VAVQVPSFLYSVKGEMPRLEILLLEVVVLGPILLASVDDRYGVEYLVEPIF
jgi:hypothetical protein